MNKSTWTTKDVVTAAISFDDHAASLVHAAADLCRRSSKTLALVHVVEPWGSAAHKFPLEGFGSLSQALAIADANKHAAAKERLATLAAAVGPDVRVVTIVAAGHLIETLCREAKSVGSSLLIVGASYADQLNPPRRGFSTALALMTSSPVPIAVIDTRYAKNLFVGPGKIMVADDLGPDGERAVQYGVEMAIGLGDTVLAHVHVNGVRAEVLRAALNSAAASSHTPVNPKASADTVFGSLISSLAEALRARIAVNLPLLAGFNCPYVPFVLTGEVTDQLAGAAADFMPHVVIFGRHHALHTKPFFLGRAPFKAMLALHRPILVVPETEGLA